MRTRFFEGVQVAVAVQVTQGNAKATLVPQGLAVAGEGPGAVVGPDLSPYIFSSFVWPIRIARALCKPCPYSDRAIYSLSLILYPCRNP